MKYYVGIDGGGTKTALVCVNDQDEIVYQTVLGPTNYLVNSLPSVLNIYQEGLDLLEKEAHLNLDQIQMVFIAMAGYGDIPEDLFMLETQVASVFKDIPFVLGNDTENAHASSLLGESGIHVIAGTGSIAYGIDQNGQKKRCGGWHHLFGDEASGYWLAVSLLQEFSKQADGRHPKTKLYDYMMETYHLESSEAILDLVIHTYKLKREKIAQFAMDLYQLAELNDPCAIHIFEKAGVELAEMVNCIYQSGSYQLPVKISYSGGVFASAKYILPSFEKHLVMKDYEIISPFQKPVCGSVILAMKYANQPVSKKLLETFQNI